MEPCTKRRKYALWHCPHCRKNVSKSTWYRHYAEFYNAETESWKEEDINPDSDFNFSESSDNDEVVYSQECNEHDMDHNVG